MRVPSGVHVALALVVAWAIFFSPAFDPAVQFLARDAGRMHWPMKEWIAQELSRGRLPEWNSYSGAGVPVIATAVDAVLHPFTLLLVALPFGLAFKAWVLLSALAAGFGAAAWARRLGASSPSAALAGVGFMLSGFVASSTDNLTYLTTVATVPWLSWAGYAFGAEGGAGRLAAAGLVSFLCAAAGDPMGWGLAVTLAAVQAVLAARLTWSHAIRRAVAFGLVCTAAAAPILLPVALWLPHSERSGPLTAEELLSWNLAPVRLLELVIPHFSRGADGSVYNPVYEAIAPDDPKLSPWAASIYAGASVLALALSAAVRDRRVRALLGGAVFTAWMSMGNGAGFGSVARGLPVLGQLRYWEKLVAWPVLLLAIAAGLGAAAATSDRRAARRLAVGGAGGGMLLLVLAVAAMTAPDAIGHALARGARGPGVRAEFARNVVEGATHAALALLALAAIAWAVERGALRRAAPPLVAALVAIDLGIANMDAVKLSPTWIATEPTPLAEVARATAALPRVIAPFDLPHDRSRGLSGFDSVARVGRRTLAPPWNVPAKVGNLDAYTGMMPARLLQARRALDHPELVRGPALWGFSLLAMPANAGAAAPFRLTAPLVLAGVDPEVPAWLVRLSHRPRAYVAHEVSRVDERGALEFVRTEDPSSGRSVVEAPMPPVYAPGGNARIAYDDGATIVVDTDVEGDAPALLVLSDQFAPGWRAEIDGARVDIVRANYLVRGVWVPPGSHRVTFTYRTPGLVPGVGIALLTAGALAAALAQARARLG